MEFANATYLWGLLGLLLPVAIHLWSRKKVITIKVGSTKLLQASEPKQISNVKLNEWWLLFLRILMVALLVLILSEPFVVKTQENVAINYLIEPSLISDDRMRFILDTLPEKSVRVLVKEFPALEDYQGVGENETPAYWQLAQDMGSIASDSLIVFSRGFIKGVKGIRPTVQANTKWIVFEPEEDVGETVEVILKPSNVEVLSVVSRASVLRFDKDTISLDNGRIQINLAKDSVRLNSRASKEWFPLLKNNPLRVGILSNDSLLEQVYYLKAAYRAISKFLNTPIEIEIIEDFNRATDFNTVVVFGSSLKESINTNLLIYEPDAFAKQLIEKGATKNSYNLTRLLNSENMVSEHLPEKLLELLGFRNDYMGFVNLNDQRVVAENQLQPLKVVDGEVKNEIGLFSITPWLWLFFVLVVVIERILSKLRKQ